MTLVFLSMYENSKHKVFKTILTFYQVRFSDRVNPQPLNYFSTAVNVCVSYLVQLPLLCYFTTVVLVFIFFLFERTATRRKKQRPIEN